MEESSSNKEDKIYLKVSYKIDIIPGIKPSFSQLYIMSGQLMEENNKLRERILGLKESLRYIKEINNSLKIEITKLENSKEKCKWCDSRKRSN